MKDFFKSEINLELSIYFPMFLKNEKYRREYTKGNTLKFVLSHAH